MTQLYDDEACCCTQVEVATPRYKTVNLGALMIGETVRRSIPIVNRSVLPVTTTPSLSPKEPDCQDITVLRLLTTSQMTLQPPKQQGRRKVEQVIKISLAFSPKKRMKQFVEEVSQSLLLTQCHLVSYSAYFHCFLLLC